MIIGYARVSADSQTLDAQLSTLRQAGATQVFAEKTSGTVTDRKALGKALAAWARATRSYGLGEFERHLILSRTAEGRVRAKARGVKFGRKSRLTHIGKLRLWRVVSLANSAWILLAAMRSVIQQSVASPEGGADR